MDNQEVYEQKRKQLSNEIRNLQKKIEETEYELENLDSSDKYNERQKEYLRTRILPGQISQRRILLSKKEKQLEFLRPDTQEDKEYRMNILRTYNDRVCDAIPEDLHLLFHGTAIHNARDIIESQGICSPGERGEQSDITSEGLIWVTSKYSARKIHTALDYAELSKTGTGMPAGCMFVIRTDKNKEIECGRTLMTNSISFKENPEALFSIITTPENIEMVKKWCEKSGIDMDKVQDYESFLQILQDREYTHATSEQESRTDKLLEDAVGTTEESVIGSSVDEEKRTIITRENEKRGNKVIDNNITIE